MITGIIDLARAAFGRGRRPRQLDRILAIVNERLRAAEDELREQSAQLERAATQVVPRNGTDSWALLEPPTPVEAVWIGYDEQPQRVGVFPEPVRAIPNMSGAFQGTRTGNLYDQRGALISTDQPRPDPLDRAAPDMRVEREGDEMRVTTEQKVAGRTIIFVPPGTSLDEIRTVDATIQFPGGERVPVRIVKFESNDPQYCTIQIQLRGELAFAEDSRAGTNMNNDDEARLWAGEPPAPVRPQRAIINPDWSKLPYQKTGDRIVPKTLTGWAGARTSDKPVPTLLVDSVVRLRNQQGTSDKVYAVMTVRAPAASGRPQFRVVVAWGRFGSKLSWQDKLVGANDWTAANRQANAVIDQKTSEGYATVGATAYSLPDGFLDMSTMAEEFGAVGAALGLRPELPGIAGQVVAVDGDWVAIEQVAKVAKVVQARNDDRRADLRAEREW